MGHHQTTFYILENDSLQTWYVGKMINPGRSISQDELNEKLYQKYPDLNPYLTLVSNDGNYNGVERYLSKLLYRINKEPEKLKDLKQLLMAGWNYDDTIETSTLTVVSGDDSLFKHLVKHREGMTRCLNSDTGKTRSEKYQECKDSNFMYERARKEVLRQMKKTGKLPKPSTCEKYQIKDDEIEFNHHCRNPPQVGSQFHTRRVQPLSSYGVFLPSPWVEAVHPSVLGSTVLSPKTPSLLESWFSTTPYLSSHSQRQTPPV